MAIARLPEIIKILSKALFEAEDRRLEQSIVRLDEQNRHMLKLQYKGFVYNGEVYIPKDATVVLKGPKPALAYELTEEMNLFLRDKYKTQLDKKQIEQVLYTLLYQCVDLQEIRDALPECLVSLVPDLAKLSRRLNTAFILRNDERAMKQYLTILPKIEFYSATRLLY